MAPLSPARALAVSGPQFSARPNRTFTAPPALSVTPPVGGACPSGACTSGGPVYLSTSGRSSSPAGVSSSGSRRRQVAAGAGVGGGANGAATTAAAKVPSVLRDPIHISASCTRSTSVRDLGPAGGPEVALQSYMQLPVDQYFVLDPSRITWVGGNKFILNVPRIELFNLWMEPVVDVTVYQSENSVVLQADNCRMYSSDELKALGLDGKYYTKFVTELKWEPGEAGKQGKINGMCKLDVWCEVVGAFQMVPREVQQSTASGVLQGVTNTMLPLFMRLLGQDYAKWSTDPEYRESRRQQSAAGAEAQNVTDVTV